MKIYGLKDFKQILFLKYRNYYGYLLFIRSTLSTLIVTFCQTNINMLNIFMSIGWEMPKLSILTKMMTTINGLIIFNMAKTAERHKKPVKPWGR